MFLFTLCTGVHLSCEVGHALQSCLASLAPNLLYIYSSHSATLQNPPKNRQGNWGEISIDLRLKTKCQTSNPYFRSWVILPSSTGTLNTLSFFFPHKRALPSVQGFTCLAKWGMLCGLVSLGSSQIYYIYTHRIPRQLKV